MNKTHENTLFPMTENLSGSARILRIDPGDSWKEVKEMLSASFTKAQMKEIADDLAKALPGPFLLMRGGKPVSKPEQYMPQRKLYTYTAPELAGFIALFLHHPDNLNLYLDAVGEDMRTLCDLLVEHRCVGISRLRDFGLTRLIEQEDTRWGYPKTRIVFHPCWFLLRLSYGPQAKDYYQWKDGEHFFLLRSEFRVLFAAALGRIPPATLRDTPPEQTLTLSAEAEALAAYPVFQGALRQELLKFSTFKVTAASSKKVMEMLPVQDITLPSANPKDKYNLGQLYFPLLDYAVSRAPGASYPEIVRYAVEALFSLSEETVIPMLLPAVKGLSRNRMYDYCRDDALTSLEEVLLDSEGLWVDLFPLFQRFVINGYHSIEARYLDNMFVQNGWTGSGITLGDLEWDIDYSLMQAACACLYGLGAAELALEEVSGTGATASPYGHICGIRLTELGRYAFSLDEHYAAPEIQQKAYFELDPDRLIIRSLESGNPYEGLLRDIAVPIGNNRFRISPESFLKRCSTKSDVEEKTRFFHDYICADPPAVWKDFFETLARRCRPLKTEKKDYLVYKLDPADDELTGLICSDPQLKDIVVRAEGYRILVPSDKRNAFVSRLKTFGYLL